MIHFIKSISTNTTTIKTFLARDMSESIANSAGQLADATESELATPAQGMIVKFLIAAILTLFAFIYFDKTSSLNGHTPEENKKLNDAPAEKKEEDEKESIGARIASEHKRKSVREETSGAKGRKVIRKRKV